MRTVRFIPLSVAATLAIAAPAKAGPLSFVNVSAPDINCVFNTTCTVTVTDSVGTITVPPLLWSGTARLQSRTYPGAAGAPGAGKTAYEYRVDLTQAVSSGEVPCVTDISIDFGPVTKLQYNKSGPLDDVFVVTKGGLGSVGLYAVEQNGMSSPLRSTSRSAPVRRPAPATPAISSAWRRNTPRTPSPRMSAYRD